MSEERVAYNIASGQSKDKRQRRPQTIHLPEELARKLRITAAEQDREMSEITEDALEIYFRSDNTSPPVEPLKKVTFYLTTAQVDKLDDLAYEHRKQTERRINRNDIVRCLINQAGIDDLASL